MPDWHYINLTLYVINSIQSIIQIKFITLTHALSALCVPSSSRNLGLIPFMVSELRVSMDEPVQSPASASTVSASNGSASFNPKTFANPVSFKLNEDNFLPWRHQALATIKAHKLLNHLKKDKVPARFNIEEAQDEENESQEFLDWEQQDQHLVAWLLASMEPEFTNRVVRCEFAHQIWSKLETLFASKTKAKVRQLKIQLKSIKKQGSEASEYLMKIKKIVDSLAAVGSPISEDDHIEAILDGLNEEYSSFITTVISRSNPFSVDELEALLMAQEELIERFKKTEIGPVQAHIAQSSNNDQKSAPLQAGGGRGNGGRRGRGRRGGRSWNNSGSRPQCQLCGKIGHTVWQCYHRFDQNFQNPNRVASFGPPPPSSSFHNPRAYLATPSTVTDNAWYPDSGASHHLTFDPRNLLTSTEFEGPDQVQIGNGAGMAINLIGNSSLHSHISNTSFNLHNLMHVPDLTKNSLVYLNLLMTTKCFLSFILMYAM